MKRYTCVGILGLLTSLPLCFAEEAPKPNSDQEAKGATINGTASIELRIDSVQKLGGIEVVLLPETAAAKIKEVRDEKWRETAQRWNFADGYTNLDIQTMGYTAVQAALQRAKADDEGAFRFENVDPGKYRLYAQYKSRYAVVYWLLPVEVKTAEDVLEVALNNETAAEIFNRRLR